MISLDDIYQFPVTESQDLLWDNMLSLPRLPRGAASPSCERTACLQDRKCVNGVYTWAVGRAAVYFSSCGIFWF